MGNEKEANAADSENVVEEVAESSKEDTPKKKSRGSKGSKEVEKLKEALKEAEEKVTECEAARDKEKENALMYRAELENYKRRKNQEVDSFKKFASEKVLLEFLPVLDSFSLACEHAETAEDKAEIIKGFVLISKQLESTLEKLDVTPIRSLHQAFDIDKHQAVGQEACEDTGSGIVVKEVQKGYMLNDRVLRHAMVIVSE